MHVKVVKEAGYDEALLGISFSYNAPIERMPTTAGKLAHMDGGHNKFLESIGVWIDIDAPRYWWSQFDTYRIGTTKQSESTMHTLVRRSLTQDDFEDEIDERVLDILNYFIKGDNLKRAKAHLPEAFLQRRLVFTNYKTLRNVYAQRLTHKLPQWQFFCDALVSQLEHPEFITKE